MRIQIHKEREDLIQMIQPHQNRNEKIIFIFCGFCAGKCMLFADIG